MMAGVLGARVAFCSHFGAEGDRHAVGRRGRSDPAAPTAPPLDEVASLTIRNKSTRDAEVEERLLRLRHEAYFDLACGATRGLAAGVQRSISGSGGASSRDHLGRADGRGRGRSDPASWLSARARTAVARARRVARRRHRSRVPGTRGRAGRRAGEPNQAVVRPLRARARLAAIGRQPATVGS